jgi:hypothetical protein
MECNCGLVHSIEEILADVQASREEAGAPDNRWMTGHE